MPAYNYTGPVDCDVDFDTANLQGTTAVVTGGANGLGEAYVRALVAAGVYVCFGDLDVTAGEKLRTELSGLGRCVECNVTKWEDQIRLFREAKDFSPTGEINCVIANAGTIKQDQVFSSSGDSEEPEEPELSVIDINLRGSLYTTKLAMHYFVKQNGIVSQPTQKDTCLILISSGAAFLDCLRIPQYSATKWAARGIMHALRRTTYHYGSRVNVISPWYVKTQILSVEAFRQIQALGVELAALKDAGQCLLRILSNLTVNGHPFFISTRKWAPRGYLDLDVDDYPGSKSIAEIQEDQMKGAPASAGLFV